MGWVLMSERELHRVEVRQAVRAGRQIVTAAARTLGISRRQALRSATKQLGWLMERGITVRTAPQE
ncbi:hypothetical protein [Methylobacterium tarhaniae]|uniref:hypothetical protein n=1 Tax=Methylobacterium tarhaniae TaxID=1187852 RepID=UPI003D0515FE